MSTAESHTMHQTLSIRLIASLDMKYSLIERLLVAGNRADWRRTCHDMLQLGETMNQFRVLFKPISGQPSSGTWTAKTVTRIRALQSVHYHLDRRAGQRALHANGTSSSKSKHTELQTFTTQKLALYEQLAHHR